MYAICTHTYTAVNWFYVDKKTSAKAVCRVLHVLFLESMQISSYESANRFPSITMNGYSSYSENL